MKMRLLAFIKREVVLVVSAIFAFSSMIFVPPSASYWEYFDIRVLCLLFCLMVVVAGLEQCGLFRFMAQRLLKGRHNMRFISLILVLLPFFSSMFITNDVSLLTFAPFAVVVLRLAGQSRHLIYLLVLQTMAANLGSMLTPIGSPQNLYLYTVYQLSLDQFLLTMLPYALISLIGLCIAALWIPSQTLQVEFPGAPCFQVKKLIQFSVLFVLCLLCVFRVIPYTILTGMVLLFLLFFQRGLFAKIDYGLLATFVCFFIFSGNLGALPCVHRALSFAIQNRAAILSAFCSQIISNVPTAVLLSGFCEDWQGLLVGTNLGGLGTPIASLASLITLKIYLQQPQARPLRYLSIFLLANGCGLILLGGLAVLLGQA